MTVNVLVKALESERTNASSRWLLNQPDFSQLPVEPFRSVRLSRQVPRLAGRRSNLNTARKLPSMLFSPLRP